MSHVFGSSTRDNQQSSARLLSGRYGKDKGTDKSEFGLTGETVCVGCVFFCYLSIIPILFVFLYHAFPTTILGIVALLALLSFIPCIFNKGDSVVIEPVGPLLAASMLACTCLVFLGSMHLYWAHVQPMRALVLAREYKGVYPQLPAAAFADAAFVKFTGNTTVDVHKSVSMKSLDAGLNTFCAAPVTNDANSGRVEFWAVGVDCCGSSHSGKFECDDAGKAGAKNAFVMQNPTDPLFDSIGKYLAPPIARRDIFLKAIRKAEHMRRLVSSEEPLFVRWTAESKEQIIEAEIVKIVVRCLANTVVSAIMAVFLAWLVHWFSRLRAAHRREKYGEQQMDVSARLNEFLTHLDDQWTQTTQWHKVVMRAPLSKTDVCLMGIVLPYIAMMLCVVLTTYSGCWRNGHLVYAPFYTVLSLAIVALLATPNRAITGLYVLLVSMMGLYIGHVNYNHNMFHYCAVDDGRSYSNVMPNASSETYWDAGILKFGSSAYLSQNYSVGFLHKDVVYCAAPVLSRNCTSSKAAAALTPEDLTLPSIGFTQQQERHGFSAPPNFLQRTARMHLSPDIDLDGSTISLTEQEPTAEDDSDEAATTTTLESTSTTSAAVPNECVNTVPDRIEFWAIGTDCCDGRKNFRCDGGQDKNAHSSVVVRATGAEQPGDEREQFFKAISQSIAENDLPAPDRPVLIRWGKDPSELQHDWAASAGGLILLTAMIGFLSILCIGASSYLYMKRMRVRELREQQRTKAKQRAATETATTTAGASAGGYMTKARDQLRV